MKWNWHNNMTVIPVAFNVDHEEKLGHAEMILVDGFLATNPEFHKLTTALRTAVAEEKSLDKETSSNDDILDTCLTADIEKTMRLEEIKRRREKFQKQGWEIICLTHLKGVSLIII